MHRVRNLIELASGLWYHGSPSDALVSDFRNYQSDVAFFTRDEKVAEHYATKPVLGAQKTSRTRPTVYTVELQLGHTFDFRNWAHKSLYEKIRANYNANVEDPDDYLPSLKSQGFLQARGLPGFGNARILAALVAQQGFDSLWVDEGHHGPSLVVWRPQRRVTVLTRRYPEEASL